ncbi:hypothetical protein HDU96_009024 [Phlyctochytrium bullatum]|nr:hypothetical protein HDU96_009024 [Phlyctochytrium bullatum]
MGGSAIVTVIGFVSAPVRKSAKVNDFYLLINNYNIITKAFCEAIWFSCTCWGNDFDPVLNILQEGTGVSVGGEITEIASTTTNDGTNRTMLCIKLKVVSLVPLLGYVGGFWFHRSNRLKPQPLFPSFSDAAPSPSIDTSKVPATQPLTSTVLTLIGRVSQSPTRRIISTTGIVCREFKLLVNNYHKPTPENQSKYADAMWFLCVCIGTDFDNKLNYFDGGKEVVVVGEIDDLGHLFIDANGLHKRPCIRVKVNSLLFPPSHRCTLKFLQDNRQVNGGFRSAIIDPINTPSTSHVKPDPGTSDSEDLEDPAHLRKKIKAEPSSDSDSDDSDADAEEIVVVKKEPVEAPTKKKKNKKAPGAAVTEDDTTVEAPKKRKASAVAVKTEEPSETIVKKKKKSKAVVEEPATPVKKSKKAKAVTAAAARPLSPPPTPAKKTRTKRAG